MNPLLSKDSTPIQQQPNTNLQQLWNAFKASNNPEMLFQAFPQLRNIYQCSHGNLKEAFYAMCKEKGVDPNSILSQFR